MEVIRLSPLAQAEIEGSSTSIVDALFADEPTRVQDAPKGRRAFVERVVRGGYPEASPSVSASITGRSGPTAIFSKGFS
jgi:hypothetical protein